ncbi:MAG: peptidase S8, partial [Bacteroidia bacterium]
MLRLRWMILMTVLLAGGSIASAQQKVWIRFADKGPEQSQWLAHPAAYLSQRALDRRVESGLQPTFADVPVSATYIQALASNGVQVQGQSRWIN